MANVLDQFEITKIVPITVAGLDLSFTNASLWMAITTFATLALLLICLYKAKVIPSRLQACGEILFLTINAMIAETAGSSGRKFFPLILTIFLMILFGNLFGLLPGAFTFTSHIAVTFFLAILFFLMVTLVGFIKHGLKYFKIFLPSGVPLLLAPMIIGIELISYLSRPVSLSVRLFANMVVGHVLIKVFAGFVIALGIFGILPFVGLFAITALEFLVAVLQAYVFAILCCVYLNDAINLH